MKKYLRKIKNERAAATTLTIVTVLGFVSVLIGAFLAASTLRQSQLRSDIKIQEIYDQSAEDTYQSLINGRSAKIDSIRAGETAVGSNKIYVDPNNDTAVIPQGFTVSGIDGEQTIENGLVIYQTGEINITDWSTNANTIKSTYNQWVWIPVTNPSEMYEENQSGVALSGSTGVTTTKYSKSVTLGSRTFTRTTPGVADGYREPDLVIGNGSQYDASNYGTAGFASLKEMAQNLVLDYNEMLDSVNQFKGFYIGRYELTGTVENPTEKSGTVLTNTNWYNLYKACKNLGKNNDKIETRMIWLNQWDEICKYINERGQKVGLDNSTTYGNFNNSVSPANVTGYGNKQITGYSEYWKTNNIYDLAGNCLEWTQGASNNLYFRTGRGFYFRGDGSNRSVTDSNVNIPDDSQQEDQTSRPTLYIRTTESTLSSLEKLRNSGEYVTKKTTVYDSDGNKVVIPQGFKVASDSGINVTEGIVIEDNDIIQGIGNNRGNQYVWVPVSNIDGDNSSNGTENNLITLNNGSKVEITLGRYLYYSSGTSSLIQKGSQASAVTSNNYSNTSNDIYKIATTHSNSNFCYELSDSRSGDNTTTNTTAQDLSGFIESVKNNNGYYFARYEASYGMDGKANSKVSNSYSESTAPTTEGTVWNFILQNQASTACQNLYNTVNSDLLNSYAWDTAISYIHAMGNTNYANANRGDNTALINTGETGDEKCKINDMAKNNKEWETEYSTYTNNPCVYRGGDFYSGNGAVTRWVRKSYLLSIKYWFPFNLMVIKWSNLWKN